MQGTSPTHDWSRIPLISFSFILYMICDQWRSKHINAGYMEPRPHVELAGVCRPFSTSLFANNVPVLRNHGTSLDQDGTAIRICNKLTSWEEKADCFDPMTADG